MSKIEICQPDNFMIPGLLSKRHWDLFRGNFWSEIFLSWPIGRTYRNFFQRKKYKIKLLRPIGRTDHNCFGASLCQLHVKFITDTKTEIFTAERSYTDNCKVRIFEEEKFASGLLGEPIEKLFWGFSRYINLRLTWYLISSHNRQLLLANYWVYFWFHLVILPVF